MEKKDFFVNEEVVNIEAYGEVFKYKPSTAGDELDWAKDYTVLKEEEDPKTGEKVLYQRQDAGKLSICKLRNIVGVPFTREELKQLCGIDKEFEDYTNEDKDKLFRKFDGSVFNKLIVAIDGVKSVQKKE